MFHPKLMLENFLISIGNPLTWASSALGLRYACAVIAPMFQVVHSLWENSSLNFALSAMHQAESDKKKDYFALRFFGVSEQCHWRKRTSNLSELGFRFSNQCLSGERCAHVLQEK